MAVMYESGLFFYFLLLKRVSQSLRYSLTHLAHSLTHTMHTLLGSLDPPHAMKMGDVCLALKNTHT